LGLSNYEAGVISDSSSLPAYDPFWFTNWQGILSPHFSLGTTIRTSIPNKSAISIINKESMFLKMIYAHQIPYRLFWTVKLSLDDYICSWVTQWQLNGRDVNRTHKAYLLTNLALLTVLVYWGKKGL
jgi:hypothetical protein